MKKLKNNNAMKKYIRFRRTIIVFVLCILLGITAIMSYHFFIKTYQPKSILQTAAVGNTKIAYTVHGKGEPLILLPGSGMTMQDWDPLLVEKLVTNHRVVILDYPGVGKSTGDLTSMNETELADTMTGFMDNLGIKKAAVLGWSAGSFIAQIIAEKYPDRVSKLILISTAPGGGQTIDTPKPISDTIQKNLGGNWESSYVPFMFADKNKANEYLQRIKTAEDNGTAPADSEASITSKTALENMFADQQQERQRYAGLKTILSPTLIIQGAKDMLIAPENAQRVAKLIPNAQLMILPDAGHAVLFEQADDVAESINNFLLPVPSDSR